MTKLRILSGGAAQGLVGALRADFSALSGLEIAGEFGAVGAMRARLAEGHPADLVILTAAILAELAETGVVLPESVADIGDVETAIARRAGDPAPAIRDEATLREALLTADAIYLPDPRLATAGIHFAGVLDRLGIAAAVAPRLHAHPNGASAMTALARAGTARPIGCTQVTEIRSTPGVEVVAPLPPGFDLKTRYTAGIVAASPQREAAAALLALLTARERQAERLRCGFV